MDERDAVRDIDDDAEDAEDGEDLFADDFQEYATALVVYFGAI